MWDSGRAFGLGRGWSRRRSRGLGVAVAVGTFFLLFWREGFFLGGVLGFWEMR